MTCSQTRPIPNSHEWRDDVEQHTPPMNPKAISIGPNRLCGRRCTQ